MSGSKRAALFVDFDNIYLGLRQVDPHAAEEFATNPSRWLAWLERHYPDVEAGADDPPRRRLLLRNCYLNPRSFSRYRADFSRAAFRVVDCPPITRQGKTSTDIHMVMDILDTLNHSTHFDEFILLSADADFTPVLFRLRLHDRRTLVVSVGPASPAYRNAADLLVSEEEFVTMALGGRTDGVERASVSAVDDEVLDEIAHALAEAVQSEGPLEPAAIPRVYVRFNSFRESTDWLGHWSLRGLTDALVARVPESIQIVEEAGHWRVMPRRIAEDSASASILTDADDLADEVRTCVLDFVRSSPAPVPMATAAHHVISSLGAPITESDWAGFGSFKRLVSEIEDTALQLVQLSPTRWILVDPERHEVPESADTVGGDSEAARLARRISRTTGVPALGSEQYAALFHALHSVLVSGVYDLTETSKAVRDELLDQGTPISRTSISFILRGIAFIGVDLTTETHTAADALARAFRRQIHSLCEDAELHLTPEEEALVDEWILGRFSGAT